MKAMSKVLPLVTAFLPFALCLIASCSPLHQKKRDPTCRELFKQIRHDCHRDAATGLYQLGASSASGSKLSIFSNQDCLKGLTHKDMEHLFGSPDTLVSGKMIYFLAEPCLGKAGVNADGCHHLCFNFDAEGGMTRINIVYVGGEMDYLDDKKGKE